MSIRVDTSSLIAGAVVIGDPGLGVLAEAVPSTGEHGPGYAYESLSFPADNGKEVRGLITVWPTNGTLVAFEDTSFEYTGTSDTFQWQLYVDGVAVGAPQVTTLQVGDSPFLAPTTGHLQAGGTVPAIAQPIGVSPAVGQVTASGGVPALGQPRSVQPAAGRAQTEGSVPAVSQSLAVSLTAGRTTASGHAPAVGQPRFVQPPAGRAQAEGAAPSIAQPLAVTLPAGRVATTGHVPGVDQSSALSVRPSVGRVDARGYSPALAQPHTLQPGSGAAVATGHMGTLVQPIGALPQYGRTALSGYQPNVVQGGALTLLPARGRALLRGYAPAVGTTALAAAWRRTMKVPGEFRTLVVAREVRTWRL